MCTLILGRDVVAPGTILMTANRDEDPTRPSDPPGVLRESPRLIGGRDRRAMLERMSAVTGPGLPFAALCRAFAAFWEAPCAPCTLVFAAPGGCWSLAIEADATPRVEPVARGWSASSRASCRARPSRPSDGSAS